MNENEGRPAEELWPSPAELWDHARRYPWIVLGAGLLGILATLGWLSRQTSVWTARATLLMHQEDAPRDGAVAPLHALAQSYDVAAEIAFLSSLAPATETVRVSDEIPFRWEGPHLGLTTQVEDLGLRPVSVLLRQLVRAGYGNGRLRAYADATEGGPRTIRVAFGKDHSIRLWQPGSGAPFSRLGERVTTFVPNEPIEYDGARLWLSPEGDVAGKTFEIRRHEPREAVRSLIERTSVEEGDIGTRVVHVIVRDSDAHRAAESVNGIVHNYLVQRRQQARERTQQRLSQIESELRRVETNLREGLAKLVHLRQESPLSIAHEASAKSLTLSLTSRGVDYTSAQLELTLVEDGIDALERGNVTALARISEATTDKLTRLLIDQLADLISQEKLGLKDGSISYLHLLEQRQVHLEEARDELALQIAALEQAVERIDAEGATALGMIVSVHPLASVIV